MALKRRQFSREFKLQVLREIESGKSVAQASREHQLHPTLISKWQKQHSQYAEQAFSGNGNAYKDEARVAELERMIGQLTMENALLKKALLRLEGLAHSTSNSSSKRSTK
jgi:transposase